MCICIMLYRVMGVNPVKVFVRGFVESAQRGESWVPIKTF